jgi:hypothetical protein
MSTTAKLQKKTVRGSWPYQSRSSTPMAQPRVAAHATVASIPTPTNIRANFCRVTVMRLGEA